MWRMWGNLGIAVGLGCIPFVGGRAGPLRFSAADADPFPRDRGMSNVYHPNTKNLAYVCWHS